MCGIVGYTGRRDAVEAILDGLTRLEYRGYDSAGIAVVSGESLKVIRCAGKVSALAEAVHGSELASTCGIGHTRWATHGNATERNAHPHRDCTGTLALVHNGIIENYEILRTRLISEGHSFTSDTDTEVLVHLVEWFYKEDTPLELAVADALTQVSGTYGIAVVSAREPDKIVAARRGSPLVIALGDGENLVASDPHAFMRKHSGVIFLKDTEIAVLKPDEVRVLDQTRAEKTPEIEELNVEFLAAEKGNYPHFMLKEIHEQPSAVENTLRGRIDLKEGIPKLGGLRDLDDRLRRVKNIVITACGTSWHAALTGEYLIEEFAQIPTEVEYASEFRYRNPILYPDTLVMVISQSGETADTLAALREAKTKGATVIGICNVPGSTISRETHAGVFTHAGPEIGVASTKAFTAQVAALTMLAVLLGRQRGMSLARGIDVLRALSSAPDLIQEALSTEPLIREIATEFAQMRNFLYLGRGYTFPLALEGALKLKEISYIHAEGYPAAEMKHGPIALIDERMPVVVVAPGNHTREKLISNIHEIRARNGRVISLCPRGDTEIIALSHRAIELPACPDYLAPIVYAAPLQLLAYHVAVINGRDVDQPRNLAKSVTVE